MLDNLSIGYVSLILVKKEIKKYLRTRKKHKKQGVKRAFKPIKNR
jgi:hypothetical protein